MTFKPKGPTEVLPVQIKGLETTLSKGYWDTGESLTPSDKQAIIVLIEKGKAMLKAAQKEFN